MFVTRNILNIICITALLVVCDGVRADETETAHGLRYGKISGQVILSESLPKLMPLIVKRADVKDKHVCASEDMPDERLVFDQQTNGVGNVFVWLHRFNPADIHPKLKDVELEPAKLTYKQCRIRPHALTVQVGQTLAIYNHDAIVHNPHHYALRNQATGVVLAPDPSEPFDLTLMFPESTPFKFTCDYHPWESAYLLVQNHPYMAVTTTSGKFELKDVPYGTHQLRIWHELSGYLERKTVTLNGDELEMDTVQMTLNDDVKASLSYDEAPAAD